jgi:hypothetical protein
MRDRAQALIATFDALPAPQTLTDMLRAARLLMALDRLLTQLWKMPADKAGHKHVATTEPEPAPETETDSAPTSLNRQQRRALEARNKAAKWKDAPSSLPASRFIANPVTPCATG